MNDKLNPVRAMIVAKNNGETYQAVDFTRKHPDIAAVLSKLTTPELTHRRHDNKGNTLIDVPNQQNFHKVSREIVQKDKDSETIKQLFPELNLGAQILISSILAPKDMNTSELTFIVPDNLKVSPIAAALVQLLNDYFTQTYKIEPLLPKILDEVLFGSGSYPMAVIPENSVDDLINGASVISTESLRDHAHSNGVFRNLGLLGPSVAPERSENFSIEDFAGSGSYTNEQTTFNETIPAKIDDKVMALEHLFITDNYDGLKMPQIIRARQHIDVRSKIASKNRFLKVGFEDFKEKVKKGDKTADLTDSQLTQLFYKNKGMSWKHTVKVKTGNELGRRTIGEALKLKLPSESVIPVFTPGAPEQHVGYFVLLDSEGNPVFKTAFQSEFSSLRSSNFNSNMGSALLQQAGRELNGGNCDTVTFDQAAQVYADIVEADLLARLRNGIYGSSVSVARNEEIYRIMLARTLKKQNTQLMYIPVELVTYFAYKYTTQGIGKSMFDDMLTLQSLRGMLLFSQVQGAVKNSIGRTRVKIKLTAEDPNPQQTVEKMMHEIANMRRGSFPVSSLSVSDLTAWSQNAALEYEIDGHPGLPDTAVEFSDTNSNVVKPDTDLDELLSNRSIMAMGLSPETVASANSVDFATTAVRNNLLLTKRVIQIQDVFVPQVTDHSRKVASNDGGFVELVEEMIKNNLEKIKGSEQTDPIFSEFADNEPLLIHLLSQEFFSNFEASLARPDAAQVEIAKDSIMAKADEIDIALGFHITDEIFAPAFVGEAASQRATEVRAMLKALLMRNWMASKNILPELSDLTAIDKHGKPVVQLEDQITQHLQRTTQSVHFLLKKSLPVAQASDASINKLTEGQGLGESTVTASTGGSSGGSYDSGGGGFDDGTGGSDDTGGDGGGDSGGLDDMPDLPKMPDLGGL